MKAIKDYGPKFQGSRHCWPGLLAARNISWQQGLRDVCEAVGEFHFQVSEGDNSGYEDWDTVAATVIFHALALRSGRLKIGDIEAIYFVLRDGTIFLILMGHSNGVKAITMIAEAVKPYGIKVYIMAFDQTLAPCPALGSNVIEAVDLHAQLHTLQRGPDFTGKLTRHDFSVGHIGVISEPRAQAIAKAKLREWVAALEAQS